MPFLMSFALEHEIVTFAWIDNASVQFPLNIYATKGATDSRAGVRIAPRVITPVFGERSVCSLPSLAAAFRESEIANRKSKMPLSASSVVNPNVA
jgi:hypothetical protein